MNASMQSNAYSPHWFDLFAGTVPAEQTRREADFVASLLRPGARVLDVGCGPGRHAALLQGAGHRVVGLDRTLPALAEARRRAPEAAWVCADMRAPPFRDGVFDAVLSLWQSFGYFDAAANAALLRRLRELLRPDGVLVMDLYHRLFFERHQGERTSERDGTPVVERKWMREGRLHVELTYPRLGSGDRFDWQVFSPEELSAFAARSGLRVVHACSGFDPRNPPSEGLPRVQYVLRPA